MKAEGMVTLIRGGDVFAPSPLGKKDILILGSKIAAVSEPGKIQITGLPVLEEDASDKKVIPGFVDSHVHILGGGGEGGPATRAPEISIQSILASGITTVIGCLGTDGTTRHMESLLAKARGLEIEGITTYIFSGSYQFPVVTITGSMRSDIALIDKIIGAGEIAISDHRSSQPTFGEFARLAAECRVGGLLGQKAGVLHCHIGDGPRKLEFLFRLIKETEIPITQVIPTHVNRNPELLDEAIRRDAQFIDRHPTTLFQCLWNNCWWYDAPDAAKHYVEDDGPWDGPAPKLHRLMEAWKEMKTAATPGSCY